MKVLYVTASCLTKNTSANMSHNAFIQGLLENNCEVDILMTKDGWGDPDAALPVWEKANYYVYGSEQFKDKLRKIGKKLIQGNVFNEKAESKSLVSPSLQSMTGNNECSSPKLRTVAKNIYRFLFPADPLYPLEAAWLKRASKFKGSYSYDLLISNSSPAASHKLAQLLVQSGNVKAKHWIQIWEDPWYKDLYGEKALIIKEEEHKLLEAAEDVFYVSPLTMEYQKQLFPDCARKMKHIPLPYLKFCNGSDLPVQPQVDFGYFGDYYSQTRNLVPFYDALKDSEFTGQIFGDSDLNLQSTDRITVNSRVTLDVLSNAQDNTKILVHLCNLYGGQIPGKIYHYSASTKPILFILDGNDSEKNRLKDYFGQYDRYYFVENDKDSIRSILQFIFDYGLQKPNLPVEEFSPELVVASLLEATNRNSAK